MDIFEKINLYNKLKDELQEELGYFDEIVIVEEYTKDMVEEDGQYYQDTGGCMETTPVVLCIRQS
jgi:hypothetical protein